ncbi:MAG: helicase C-terminal domain-containing protein [Chloroflexota bacterium]|nr:helicase C-terminal domain-containing protein [Chloroflexota bacterium]
MNNLFISLDLETTGLNSDSDSIIEVGAVKFYGDEVIDTFHTMVNPFRPLSYRIKWLTGITSRELSLAPSFDAVASDLVSFMGQYPIVGQNISFDVAFLSSHGIELSSPLYDTLELSRIVLPDVPDYTLATLAKELGVHSPIEHRALADAVTAKEVFLLLSKRISQLPVEILKELIRITHSTHSVWHSLFVDIGEKRGICSTMACEEVQELTSLFMSDDFSPVPLEPSVNYNDLDPCMMESLLGKDSQISATFQSFELRPGQMSMLRSVTKAFNEEQCLIVEAGPGIGKSIAYLIPSIFSAIERNNHIVISTNTINLQEQLLGKDIPDLLNILDVSQTIRVARIKERSDYLCIGQFNALRREPHLMWEEAKFVLRLAIWLSGTATGDCGELRIGKDEDILWKRVCASAQNCSGEQCDYYKNGCFVNRACEQAAASHLIITNHDLLLSDMVNGSSILPDHDFVIIDEAHHLEHRATEQLGYRVDTREMYRYLDRITDKREMLSDVSWYRQCGEDARGQYSSSYQEDVEDLISRLRCIRSQIFDLFTHLNMLVHSNTPGFDVYERNLRITEDIRFHPEWEYIRELWGQLDLGMIDAEAILHNVYVNFDGRLDIREWDIRSLRVELMGLMQRLQEFRQRIDRIIKVQDENEIHWISLREQEDAVLHSAPLRLDKILEDRLYSRRKSVVLTSPTLSVSRGFDYFKGAIGLTHTNELKVDSPFNYLNSTLVYLPSGIPMPNQPGYQRMVEQVLLDLCRTTRGRVLILFTSHAQLRMTRESLQTYLDDDGILLLGQGVDGSTKHLVETFRSNDRTILMGASSLWEGVDVVGDALSVLVITKLPFSVPTDPVIEARSELFHDAFNEYNIPQTIIKFKQGFSRLIRSKNDRGAMIVLDSRLQTRSYGKDILNSLPQCTIKKGPVRRIPREVVSWLRINPEEGKSSNIR